MGDFSDWSDALIPFIAIVVAGAVVLVVGYRIWTKRKQIRTLRRLFLNEIERNIEVARDSSDESRFSAYPVYNSHYSKNKKGLTIFPNPIAAEIAQFHELILTSREKHIQCAELLKKSKTIDDCAVKEQLEGTEKMCREIRELIQFMGKTILERAW